MQSAFTWRAVPIMELASCRRSCSVIDAGSLASPGLLRTPVDSSRFERLPTSRIRRIDPRCLGPGVLYRQVRWFQSVRRPASGRQRAHMTINTMVARDKPVVRCARLHCFYARRRITTQPRKRSTRRSLPAAGHSLENRWTCKRPLGSNPSPAALQPTLESASSAFAPPLGRGRRELRSGRMQSLRGRMSHPDRQ